MSTLYEFGNCRLDSARRLVTNCGTVVPLAPLAPKTFDLLLLLIESQGRVLSKSELMTTLWPDTFVEESNLSFQVSTLRKALGGEGTKWIETLPKHGYRFAGEVVQKELSLERETSVPVEGPPPPIESAPTEGSRRHLIPPGFWLVAAACGIGLGLLISKIPGPEATDEPLKAVPLTSYQGVETTPAFSPDGSQLVFSWDGRSRANFDIYVIAKGCALEIPRRGCRGIPTRLGGLATWREYLLLGAH